MSKKCVKCGHTLPDDASFCPHCTAVQTEKQEVKMPRRWRKKVLIGLGALAVAAIIGAAFSIYHRPKTYEGRAQIVYPDGDKSYKVLLSFSESDGMTGHAQGERTDTLSEGLDSALPCQLYVIDEDTGELAGKAFSEKVESCRVDTVPAENSQKLEYVEPVYNEDFPNAAYVSDVHYTADSGTNDIEWKLTMKNGDTISLSTRLTIEKLSAVTYRPEDVPMETTEELNALLASIDEEISSDTPIHLYLPAVTYDGDITFGNHMWSIYGSTDGDAVTTFTGTVSIKGQDGNFADVSGISFEGESGTGLDAYCFVALTDCKFEGWDTAAIANDEAWVNTMNCTFTDNAVALKFNSSMAYGTSPDYLNNTFIGNGTAVCIDDLPGNEVLDFAGSTFSGNDTDIENKADHPVNTVNATFE